MTILLFQYLPISIYLNKPKKKPPLSCFCSSFIVFVLSIISLLLLFMFSIFLSCCWWSNKLSDSAPPNFFIFSQSLYGVESFCVRLKSVIVYNAVPQMNISVPYPPVSVSLPCAPTSMSLPLSPNILSFPSAPCTRSFPALPFRTSLH